ncbi:hypothetical protein GJU39_12480 [Pedobacter petrophilus]|uniref:Glycosyl transferase n=1 Tax=Pedobacter petrophilus TaxID=1908241 RepID=A0A7K0G0Q1_9SPHI|nr:hypothetical protein [Pedobacter petrophilus]MRX76904.1 hypothetical protein [Pedobacter petrophilus]
MTLFFTVVTSNYLPFAVSLLDSAKSYHPEFEFCICLADYLSSEEIDVNNLMKKYPILQLHELGVEEFDFITQNYNPMQLANCSKVLFAKHFLNQKHIDQVIFCDSDTYFFGKLPSSTINGGEIVITPHFTHPPDVNMKRQELEILNAGLYNGGFFKLKKSSETDQYITWLRERSVKECIYDFKRGFYGEQLWLNLVPLYFKNVFIENNTGINVAYWNLHERKISNIDGQFFVNETTPLCFFHYSGWNYNNPSEISTWALFTAKMRPDLKQILEKYYITLKQNEYELYINKPNYYTSKNNTQKKSFFKNLKSRFFKAKV